MSWLASLPGKLTAVNVRHSSKELPPPLLLTLFTGRYIYEREIEIEREREREGRHVCL